MIRLKGIRPDLMTPFKENGDIDYEFLIENLSKTESGRKHYWN